MADSKLPNVEAQPPSDDDLKDLAHSAYEEAMSFGLTLDVFLRDEACAPLRLFAPKTKPCCGRRGRRWK